MKKFTKTLTTLAVVATLVNTAYIVGKWNSEKVETADIQTDQLVKVNKDTAVTKKVTEPSEEVETTERTETVKSTEPDTTNNMTGYANAMTVDPETVGVGIGGAGFKEGSYFQVVGGEKVGTNGFSFYVISQASRDCIKVTCSSDNYEKAYAFVDYMNELAPNGKTNNGLKSNFDYYMNN